jgi:ligand-binding sensor protein
MDARQDERASGLAPAAFVNFCHKIRSALKRQCRVRSSRRSMGVTVKPRSLIEW